MKSNQRLASYEADCAECCKYIAQDDPIWFFEGSIYCTTCAVKKGIDCPKCHGSKKPEFEECWACHNAPGGKPVTKKASLI